MADPTDFEWCVEVYDNMEADGDPLFHCHVHTPMLSVELAGALMGLQAIEDNVSLKNAKIALITAYVGLDPMVCAQQDAMRAAQHPQEPPVVLPPGTHLH